ncbi:MAG: hypothetical protein V1754_03510 [Pseudomonadota bacterium]
MWKDTVLSEVQVPVLARVARKLPRYVPPPFSRVSLNFASFASSRLPMNPEAKASLVCETLQKLEETLQLVDGLEELPIGDRRELVKELTSTADSLRALSFIDAIY